MNDVETSSQESSPGWLQTILIGRSPQRTFVRIVVIVALVFLARAYVILPIRVSGPSMMPTYSQDGVNFVNQLAYLRSTPVRGDVVAIRLAGKSIMYMKRIVGLPGEEIAFHNGHLVIDGEEKEEPYVKYACDWERAP